MHVSFFSMNPSILLVVTFPWPMLTAIVLACCEILTLVAQGEAGFAAWVSSEVLVKCMDA